MKVLLTGANGFIGSKLLVRLIKENFKVAVILRKSTKLKRV
jgi:nucleoside-diphosphate-sugar epimerase